jgi:hypothetical protein
MYIEVIFFFIIRSFYKERCSLIAHTHVLVRATNERFLPVGGNFRVGLASESHWLQPVLVLTIHWWPTPINVGELYHYLCGSMQNCKPKSMRPEPCIVGFVFPLQFGHEWGSHKKEIEEEEYADAFELNAVWMVYYACVVGIWCEAAAMERIRITQIGGGLEERRSRHKEEG